MFDKWIIFILCSYFIQYAVNGVEYKLSSNQKVTANSYVSSHPAYMVTDQNLNTYVQVDYVPGVPAWIQFDLKHYTWNFSRVIIWPTNDADYELAKVAVYMTYYNRKEKNEKDLFCTYDNPRRGIPFNCVARPDYKDKLTGYVLLIKDSIFSTESLKIAEIAIIKFRTESFIKNWNSLQQSNGITGGGLKGPENAVDVIDETDDDFKTCIYTDQAYISLQNIRGWWRADLGESYRVYGYKINDHYTENQAYRGNYTLSVGKLGYSDKYLCAHDYQASAFIPKFVFCTYNNLIGRYITVEREAAYGSRLDMLSFCNIDLGVEILETIYEDKYIYPETTTTTNNPTSPSYIVYIIIAASIVGGILICVISCCICVCCIRKRNARIINERNARLANTRMDVVPVQNTRVEQQAYVTANTNELNIISMERTNNEYTGEDEFTISALRVQITEVGLEKY